MVHASGHLTMMTSPPPHNAPTGWIESQRLVDHATVNKPSRSVVLFSSTMFFLVSERSARRVSRRTYVDFYYWRKKLIETCRDFVVQVLPITSSSRCRGFSPSTFVCAMMFDGASDRHGVSSAWHCICNAEDRSRAKNHVTLGFSLL